MAVLNALYGATRIGTSKLTDGHIYYACDVYPIGSKVFGVNAVYAFVSGSGPFPVKYIGKADVLSERLEGHERLSEARLLGADQLWVHIPHEVDRIRHEEAERRLIQFLKPPMNTHYK